jgi:ABC-type tungstate transport system permease subunit
MRRDSGRFPKKTCSAINGPWLPRSGAAVRIEAWEVALRNVAIVVPVVGWLGVAEAQERAITVASTTSTEQSGLFGYLLPQFKKTAGIDGKVVGTGQAVGRSACRAG